MSQPKITIKFKNSDEVLTAEKAFVDTEGRLVEIPLGNGLTRKIPFESILYFDMKLRE